MSMWNAIMRYIFWMCVHFAFWAESFSIKQSPFEHFAKRWNFRIHRIEHIWTNLSLVGFIDNGFWWTFDMKLIYRFISFLSYRQMNFTCFFFCVWLLLVKFSISQQLCFYGLEIYLLFKSKWTLLFCYFASTILLF